MYLFLVVLGLHCCVGLSLVVAGDGYSLVVVCRLLTVVASLIVEHEHGGAASPRQGRWDPASLRPALRLQLQQ